MNYKVYSLLENGKIRYIGFTRNKLTKRLSEHIRKTPRNSHRDNWIRKLKKENNLPTILLLEENLTKECAIELEKLYILWCKILKINLVNGTTGGETGFTYTKETIEKLSASSKKHTEMHFKHGSLNPMYGKTGNKNPS